MVGGPGRLDCCVAVGKGAETRSTRVSSPGRRTLEFHSGLLVSIGRAAYYRGDNYLYPRFLELPPDLSPTWCMRGQVRLNLLGMRCRHLSATLPRRPQGGMSTPLTKVGTNLSSDRNQFDVLHLSRPYPGLHGHGRTYTEHPKKRQRRIYGGVLDASRNSDFLLTELVRVRQFRFMIPFYPLHTPSASNYDYNITGATCLHRSN
ncbi:hypothetical protein JVT61DRAFT_14032 [Boletus reticuloceps]|uniref:Uncharacterized protein n=1 Tax=Boletus reticuloceps TaxID=495285 RepID=A0A8I2YU02_9AGAM|nr:hypothetical protein JVT61DRAFT_14032 [Boletus reticuloceps]